MRLRVVLALVVLGAALGCTVHNPPPTPPPDAGTDARAHDAGLVHDSGALDDAGTDAAMVDAAIVADAGHDAGSDGGTDAGRDGGSDAGSDGGRDAGHDAALVLPGVLNETNVAAEADYCVLQFPATTTTTAGSPSEMIFGRIFEAGQTNTTVGSAASGILSELGYGPIGTDPSTSTAWVFHAATFNVETGIGNNDDEYMSTLTISAVGTYAYTYRFSFDGGANVTYCDLDGAGSNGGVDFSTTQLGSITVN